MGNLLLPERWTRIIDLVDQRGGVTVEEVAHELAVSPATARRDLARIHERGLIRRTHGGAAPSPSVRIGRTLAESRHTNPEEKERIGRAAAALVKPGETLMLDGGFTTYQVAAHIAVSPFTVVTNSFDVVQAVLGREGATIVFLGGTLNLISGTTVGPLTQEQALQLWADRAILGADALSPAYGISSPNAETAQTKKAMAQRAGKLMVVADHTKLGGRAVYHVAPVQSIATLVTDDRAEPGMLEAFRAAGVEVVVAPAGATDGR